MMQLRTKAARSDTKLSAQWLAGIAVTGLCALAALSGCTTVNKIATDAPADSSVFTYTIEGGKVAISKVDSVVSGALTIPASIEGLPVTFVYWDAFSGCDRLTSIFIPSNVVALATPWQFSGCARVERIDVSGDNPKYSSVDGVLFRKDRKWIVQYPAGKKGPYVIPEGVVGISSAFDNALGLTRLSIPSTVTNFGFNGIFHGSRCSELMSIDVADGNTKYCSVEGVLLSKDKRQICLYPGGRPGDYTVPQSVTGIANGAFFNCGGLTNLFVEAGNSSFSSVNGVLFSKDGKTLVLYPPGRRGEYAIPDGVVGLGTYAFATCTNLTAVAIPTSVTGTLTGLTGTTRKCPFYGCESLARFTVDPQHRVYASIDGVLFDANQTRLLRFPPGRAGSYTVPAKTTAIGAEAFIECDKITNVVLPAAFTDIGYRAFSGCEGLARIDISGTITNIGERAFGGCTKLVEVNLATGVTQVGIGAFSHCTSLRRIAIPDSVTRLEQHAFSGCSQLRDLVLPSGITAIRYGLCVDCASLRSVAIPAGVTRIEGSAFRRCSQLSTIEIPSSVTNIAADAFSGCPRLQQRP